MEQLTFTKQGSAYVCELTATKGVVQVEQITRGIVSVSANLPDMPPSVIAVYDNPYGSNTVIFEVDVPEGATVTVKSATEVSKALWIQL